MNHIDSIYAFISLFIIMLGTLATRVLPALIFSLFKIPNLLFWLSTRITPCIIGMLLVYCFKDIDLSIAPHGAYEILGVFSVVAVYFMFIKFKSNGLIAIFLGSTIYMMAIYFKIFN